MIFVQMFYIFIHDLNTTRKTTTTLFVRLFVVYLLFAVVALMMMVMMSCLDVLRLHNLIISKNFQIFNNSTIQFNLNWYKATHTSNEKFSKQPLTFNMKTISMWFIDESFRMKSCPHQILFNSMDSQSEFLPVHRRKKTRLQWMERGTFVYARKLHIVVLFTLTAWPVRGKEPR